MIAGDTATLGTPPSGPVAVNLDISPTITALNFQNANSYTISGSNIITLQGVVGGDPSFLNILQGEHVINSEVDLNNNTALTVTASLGAVLDLFGPVTDLALSSVNFNGPGTVNAINTSTTGTVMTINGPIVLDNGMNLNFINDETISTGFGYALQTAFPTGSLTLNSGTYSLINNADLQGSGGNTIGVFNLFQNGVTVNGGTLQIINRGNLTGTSIGTTVGNVFVTNVITINGGVVRLSDEGFSDALSIGSVISYGSSITINGGILINDGAVIAIMPAPNPGVIVEPQGTLAGNGRFLAGMTTPFMPTIVINNGTVIPGSPDPVPGTMTIQGTYQQSSSGTLLSNISNINSYGQLSSTDATITGSLDLFGVSGIKVKPGDAFIVLTTTDGVSGTFSSVNMLNTPFIPMVFYFPNFVEVILNAGTYPALYQSVFASINHKNIRLEREMQNLHKRFTGAQAVPQEVARNRMFSSRQGPTLAANLGAQTAPVRTERQQERLHREMEVCNDTPWNVYFGPIGSVGEVHRKGFNAGFDEWSAGALAGFDYAFEEVGVGLLAEYERLHGDVHRNWGKFNIDQAHASFYATYVPQSVPELAVNGIIGGGYEGSHIRRNTGMTGKSVAQGSSHGGEFDALFGLEYAVTSKQVQEFSDNFRFTPMVNLQYVYVNFPKYKEHGAGIFDLSVSHLTAQSLRSTLGAWFNYLWQWTDLSINLEADVGWQREYFDRGSSIKFTGVSSSTLQTRGAGRNTCLAGLDLLFTLYKTYGIEASYDFEWNKMFHDHSFYIGFNIEF